MVLFAIAEICFSATDSTWFRTPKRRLTSFRFEESCHHYNDETRGIKCCWCTVSLGTKNIYVYLCCCLGYCCHIIHSAKLPVVVYCFLSFFIPFLYIWMIYEAMTTTCCIFQSIKINLFWLKLSMTTSYGWILVFPYVFFLSLHNIYLLCLIHHPYFLILVLDKNISWLWIFC